MPICTPCPSPALQMLTDAQTWSTLVLSQPPLKVEVVGTLAIRALFFLVPSLLFLLFDSIIPSLAVGMKTQGSAALPTRTGGVRVKKRGSGAPSVLQVIGLSLFNIFLGVAIQSAVELLFTEVLHIRSALKVSTTLPMPWSIFKDVVRGLLLREVCTAFRCIVRHTSYLRLGSPNTDLSSAPTCRDLNRTLAIFYYMQLT